jgi:hypothetical protein
LRPVPLTFQHNAEGPSAAHNTGTQRLQPVLSYREGI